MEEKEKWRKQYVKSLSGGVLQTRPHGLHIIITWTQMYK